MIKTSRWSSSFSLARLTVVVHGGPPHTVAIALLTRQERRLKPELQRGGEQVGNAECGIRNAEWGKRSAPTCISPHGDLE